VKNQFSSVTNTTLGSDKSSTEKIVSESFFLRVQTLMKMRGLTQEALAKSIGISQATISGWRAGSKPQPRTARLIAEFFGVTLQWLTTGEGERTTDTFGAATVNEPAVTYQARPSSITWAQAAGAVEKLLEPMLKKMSDAEVLQQLSKWSQDDSEGPEARRQFEAIAIRELARRLAAKKGTS
jgi:transcriptional regulator with XRE-family HTH domain